MPSRLIVILWPVSLVAAGWVGGELAAPPADNVSVPTAPPTVVRADEASAPQLGGGRSVEGEPGARTNPPGLRADAAPSDPREGLGPPGGSSTDLADLRALEGRLLAGDAWALIRQITAIAREGDWLYFADSPRDRALRLLWLDCLLEHRDAVLDLLENLLARVAHRPETLPADGEDASLCAVDAFDDLLFALPHLVSEARLGRFVDVFERIRIQDDEGVLPDHLNDWDAGKYLVVWASLLEPDAMLVRLGEDGLDSREYAAMVRQLSPDQRSTLESTPLLLRMIEAHASTYDLADALRLLPRPAGDLTSLDEAVLRRGILSAHELALYLNVTGRGTWPACRAFFERCLARSPAPRPTVISALEAIQHPPPASYIEDLLDEYDLGERVEEILRQRWGIR